MKSLIGLVTHANSRYTDKNFVHNISRLQESPSLEFLTDVSDKDLSTREIGLFQVVRHYLVSVTLEVRFSRFISKEVSASYFLVLYAKKLRDVIKLVIQIILDQEKLQTECSRLRRFDNINLSHLNLFELALHEDCDFLIILEDDAFAPTPERFSELIIEIENDDMLRTAPIILNTSISTDFKNMGVNGLEMKPKGTQTYYSSPFAITNSACANVYNYSFIDYFFQNSKGILEKGITSFVPIDQILNMFILMDSKHEKKLITYHMTLPVFRQLSMPSN
jgi:hypothetical protein